MNPKLKNTLLALLVLALAYFALSYRGEARLPVWAEHYLSQAHAFYDLHPILTVALFCLLRFLCDCFCVPVSTTVLNIFAGALFGFWKAIAIVYPLTIFSACVGYFAAGKLRNMKFMRRHKANLNMLQEKLDGGGFLFLVSLRLSPVFPYGVINPAMGLLRVKFPTFLASLIVGVFFDVVILTSIGGSFGAAGNAQPIDSRVALGCFLVLIVSTVVFRAISQKPQRNNSK